MKPLALPGAALALCAVVAVALWLPGRYGPAITVTDARLVPMRDGHALVLEIDNPGAPDRLLEVSTGGDGQLMMVGAPFSAGLPVPAGAAASLAADGAHGMLMGLAPMAAGRLVPIALHFERAGTVATRARVTEVAAMDHAAVYEVPEGEAAPELEIEAAPAGDGWRVRLAVRGFAFAPGAMDGPHAPGEGHAHLYLDGLKLGRVFHPEVTVGALPEGPHEFRVTLNTNDHRVYAVDGSPVAATARVVAGPVRPE